MDRPAWHRELRALIDRAVLAEGRDAVSSALRGESDRLSARVASEGIVVDVPVLGLDAADEGWVGVLLGPGLPAAVLAGATVSALVELARESVHLAAVAIGLPVDLPAHSLRARRRDIDTWLRSKPTVAAIDVHPGTSLERIAGHPLSSDKETEAGAAERRALLVGTGLVPPAWFRGSGFDEHDLLDACAAAWSALRWTHGEAESLPPQTDVVPDGSPAAIWV